MPKPSANDQVEYHKQQVADLVRLRRLFRSELKKLRSLSSPKLAKHWWLDGLTLTYKAKLVDMRESAKWIDKFSLIVPLESITSDDSESEGTRSFSATYEKDGKKLFLRLDAEPFSDEENPLSKCRKVQVGVDTHTYTSTTPRYKLVCED